MHSNLLLPGIHLAETVPITYVDADGTETTVDAEIGKNLLDAAHDNNVELEGTCRWCRWRKTLDETVSWLPHSSW
jgi:hypothetical protein